MLITLIRQKSKRSADCKQKIIRFKNRIRVKFSPILKSQPCRVIYPYNSTLYLEKIPVIALFKE
jgi:hypothetical protein